MKTNVYIDGLNLYYRAVRGTQYKWLDIDALLKKMCPQNIICKIKYFTSIVSSRPIYVKLDLVFSRLVNCLIH